MPRARSIVGDTRLLRQLEITRVAQVSGLDRTGVEVACAVRPRGHVLQVCNGKGTDFESAAQGAILEAAELWASERVDPMSLLYGSMEQLARSGQPVVGADELGEANDLWSPKTWLAWREGTELHSGQPLWLPAHVAHCLPAGGVLLGPAVLSWTSNGMGAHPDRRLALTHALLEAIERDQLARTLPDGWTRRAVHERMIEPASLSTMLRSQVRFISERGFGVHLFDLTPPQGLGLPLAGALLVDRDQGPVPLTAGYACALRRDDALRAALLEAAQSRLTDVHGAREDVSAADEHGVSSLRRALSRAAPSRRASQMPNVKSASSVAVILRRLWRGGFRRVVAMELAPPDLGLSVVKVAIPGFWRSELL